MATILFMLYGLFFSMMNARMARWSPLLLKTPTNAPHCGMASGWRYIGPAALYGGIRPVMNLIEGNQQLGYIFAATLFHCSACCLCGSAIRA